MTTPHALSLPTSPLPSPPFSSLPLLSPPFSSHPLPPTPPSSRLVSSPTYLLSTPSLLSSPPLSLSSSKDSCSEVEGGEGGGAGGTRPLPKGDSSSLRETLRLGIEIGACSEGEGGGGGGGYEAAPYGRLSVSGSMLGSRSKLSGYAQRELRGEDGCGCTRSPC